MVEDAQLQVHHLPAALHQQLLHGRKLQGGHAKFSKMVGCAYATVDTIFPTVPKYVSCRDII